MTRPGPGRVGLRPAGARWLTPEAQAKLARRRPRWLHDYIHRVRRGGARSAWPATTAGSRARRAGARAGRRRARVAVVSSGDPGIFAMASAVFEGSTESTAHSATSRCACCRGCRPCGRRPLALARRSVTTSPCCRCLTCEAVGGDRAAARGGRGRRSGARPLQPGVAHTTRPARASPRRAPSPPRSVDARGRRPGGRRRRRVAGRRHARRTRHRRGHMPTCSSSGPRRLGSSAQDTGRTGSIRPDLPAGPDSSPLEAATTSRRSPCPGGAGARRRRRAGRASGRL